MSAQKNIDVYAFGIEVGKLGYDNDLKKCFFQYNPDFLDSGKLTQLFPFIFKRTKPVQIFTAYHNETFKGLPPMISDSLPDMFGNIIFQEWLKHKNINKISPLEQLTYVANRGMGALEYQPAQELSGNSKIEIEEIASVLQKVLQLKNNTISEGLSNLSLLNIFKIGTSAGGVKPKILIAEHKETGVIITGDTTVSEDYHHYLVKLHLDDEKKYNAELIEYAYYQLAQQAGIHMMPSKLIDDKHFATLRFDRQNGEKKHVLTACGLTGWDFQSPENSSYENVFKLAHALKVPHKDLEQLFKRMVFNLIFKNIDDHLKNHSFIYNPEKDSWNLAPAYDVTYALNPLLNYTNVSRALSINGKRQQIVYQDLLTIAQEYAIKNPKGIIEEIQQSTQNWHAIAQSVNIPENSIEIVAKDFERVV